MGIWQNFRKIKSGTKNPQMSSYAIRIRPVKKQRNFILSFINFWLLGVDLWFLIYVGQHMPSIAFYRGLMSFSVHRTIETYRCPLGRAEVDYKTSLMATTLSTCEN